ncbi:hypothetical protein SAMN05216387_10749 [Nitrosovibrio tenuis]|uniref:Uncharacterized protein n=1 Tax=Nitrosovibrio tenuis TaxID=1233 RepID=A0A1H7NK66_9PROT|nr:hypothetical protein SAMN05216387_10749 [Nitrosovibrio tenuis]
MSHKAGEAAVTCRAQLSLRQAEHCLNAFIAGLYFSPIDTAIGIDKIVSGEAMRK